MSSTLERIKGMFRRAATSVEEVADGEEPVATPAPGSTSGSADEPDREGSTNAQVGGAAEEPWSGES